MIEEVSSDVLVVGAGPIGLELAAALKRHGVDYLQIEAGNIASTIAWYSPGTQIFSSPDRIAIAGCPFMLYPGVRALREDYLNYLRTVVEQHRLPIRRYCRLAGAERVDGGFVCRVVHSSGGVGGGGVPGEGEEGAAPEAMRVRARRVVLAIGNMHGARRLGIPGEDAPWASHCLGDVHGYAGCRVAIVGARNSAAEAAVRLARLGCEVVMCIRRGELEEGRIKPWIMPDLRTLVREGKVRIETRVTPSAIEPGRLVLTRLDGSKGRVVVEAERVLLLTGYVQWPGVFEMFGVATAGAGRAPVFDEKTMETSVPGVFVAGTAAAGTAVGSTTHFIENCHVHVGRVLVGLGVCEEAPGEEEVRPVEFREE